ncbi:hypothetical protein CAPTEDRAFT_191774 [Capitella teleta]|uniref:RRM domain-containing protein n=1 Tax=Capitella teleta TaxID=283909 RepID=R7TQ48_CAPTE|nr:hypothetical protein CAPTEDRAFT_191774 [Capitella teleta]|eukprot:ELT93636.1 hypothetical protein CAPTEDRAFT_191774 [Capitella teleta]
MASKILCEICQVEVPTDAIMQQHLKGKRHQKEVDRQKLKEQNCESSIYVRGYRRGTPEEDIRELFEEQFGKVETITVLNDCHFSFVKFAEKSSALKAIETKTVMLGGQKISIRPRQVKSGVSLQDKKDLKRKHKEQMERSEKDRERREEKIHEVVMKKIFTCSDFNQQMRAIRSYLELSQEGHDLRKKVMDDLHSILVEFLPGCQVVPFGSAVSGFGVASSDLDVFLDLSDLQSHAESNQELLKKANLNFHDIPGVELNDRGVTFGSGVTLHQQIKVVDRILGKAANGVFSRPTKIASARCPVIKTSHCTSRILCDITLSNKLAVQNTRLLKLYSSISDDIITLIHVLRYWAKRQEVTGSGVTSHPRLTNYALTILIVHFMVNKYGLPSPEELSKMTDAKTLIDTWDCSLPASLPSSYTTFLPSSPWEMLRDFFQDSLAHFKNFDFGSHVVVSRTGKYANAASANLPADFKMSCLNVQDPFDLSHNITVNVNSSSLQRILKSISQAAELHSMTELNFFRNLFFKPVPATKSKQTPSPTRPLTDLTVTFDISMSIWWLPPDQLDSAFAEWCENVIRLTKRVISEVLHGEPAREEPETKRAKMSDTSSACSFTLPVALWVGRTKAMKAIEKSDDYYETELACSRAMMEVSESVLLPSPLNFHLTVTPFVLPQERGVKVSLTPFVNDGNFRAFFMFFQKFLSKIVDRCVPTQKV